jgi:hypothetical protein
MTLNGEVLAFDLYAEAKLLRLSWRPISGSSGEREKGEQGEGEREGVTEIVPIIIPIVRVPCRLGGSCPYFLCPGNGCGRRVTKLYVSQSIYGPIYGQCRFLCRLCSRLVYASKHEQPWQRAFRRANKLRQRLDIAGAAVSDNRMAGAHLRAPA